MLDGVGNLPLKNDCSAAAAAAEAVTPFCLRPRGFRRCYYTVITRRGASDYEKKREGVKCCFSPCRHSSGSGKKFKVALEKKKWNKEIGSENRVARKQTNEKKRHNNELLRR